METEENSSGALRPGEHGWGSYRLQSPGSVRRPLVESSTSKSDCTGNCVLVGPSGRKGELERSAKDLIRHRFSNPLGALTPAERYVAKYAAKEDTKVNRSLSGREMLNWPSLQSFPADLAEKGFFALQNKEKKLGK